MGCVARFVLFASALVVAGCSCSAPAPRRDAGVVLDAAMLDTPTRDTTMAADVRATDTTTDSPVPDVGGALDVGTDARGSDSGPMSDAGCTPGTSRPCTLMCSGGTTATGRQLCLGGDAWSACERPSEYCGNALDDDGDGLVDEDCRAEGGCIWIHPQCQGVFTLNDWCDMAGMRLVAGRRCAVAGADVVPLDTAYGEYPLCCCDAASMCVPVCTDPSCAACVVWDEIQCCP